jgi:lysozyme family protein
MPEFSPELRFDYERKFDTCAVHENRQVALEEEIAIIAKGKVRYEAVGTSLLIPWQWIGCIHMLEARCNFACHLHNGDPLTARTVHAPAGRPASGEPPFYWHTSALDALVIRGLTDRPGGWDIAIMLYEAERWNGFGYRNRLVPSPYLWAGSNHYEKGKFRSDHTWDPDAVSKQIGFGVLLKRLLQLEPMPPPSPGVIT